MIENRRYCPDCDDNTVQLREGRNGFFYGCINYQQGCKFTQAKDAPPAARQLPGGTDAPIGKPVDYSRESLIAQAQTRDAQSRGTAELDEMAAKKGMVSCADIMQQLQARVPGFGTVSVSQLDEAERHHRADVLGEFLSSAVHRMIQPLPYDKNDRSGR